MKIGFSCFLLDKGQSGIGTYIRELISAIAKVDDVNEYDLLMLNEDKGQIDHLSSSMHVKLYSEMWRSPLTNILWHNTFLPLTSHYDVVHIPDSRRVPLVKRAKLIATVHDLGPYKIENKYGRMRDVYHRWFVPSTLQRCDHIICVSHATKQDLIDIIGYPENKISVIYSGINTEKFKPIQTHIVKKNLIHRYGLSKPFFVYVSRIEHPAKNHYHLIKAFEIYKERYKDDAQLVLVGALWNRSNIIEQLIRSSHFKQDIQLLGFIPEEDLVYLYNGCEAMLFPSLHEGFGFPLLEAMASGAAVACSNTTSLRELGKDYAYLFDPLEPEEIVQQMYAASKQSEEKRETNIQYAQTFSWEEAATRVISVYDRA